MSFKIKRTQLIIFSKRPNFNGIPTLSQEKNLVRLKRPNI